MLNLGKRTCFIWVIRKRAEIAGKLEVAQTEVRQLIIDVDNVDATIRLFAPNIDLEEIRAEGG